MTIKVISRRRLNLKTKIIKERVNTYISAFRLPLQENCLKLIAQLELVLT